MIDRIPKRGVLPLVGLLRRPARKPQSLFNTSHARPDSCPRQSQCPPPIRFYASPTTNNFRPPSPPDARFPQLQSSNVPSQQSNFQHDPSYTTLPPPRPKRSLRPYIYATTFFLIGSLAGKYISLVVSPPTPPLPGTVEDAAQTALIHRRAAKLPIVQALNDDPDWHSWDAYSIFTPEERTRRITTGPLGGAGGLGGYQRIFYNEKTGEIIDVVWIGGAVSGWPGVVHGGLLATVLDECLGRCATARLPSRTGVTARLEVNYKAPAVTNAFYVVRATAVPDGSTERKSSVVARLENMDGRVCAEATGLFVVPKSLALRTLKPAELKDLDEGF